MLYPPNYVFVLISMEGFPREFVITDRDEAMAAWVEYEAQQNIKYLHGFLYVQPTGGFGDERHLLHSF